MINKAKTIVLHFQKQSKSFILINQLDNLTTIRQQIEQAFPQLSAKPYQIYLFKNGQSHIIKQTQHFDKSMKKYIQKEIQEIEIIIKSDHGKYKSLLHSEEDKYKQRQNSQKVNDVRNKEKEMNQQLQSVQNQQKNNSRQQFNQLKQQEKTQKKREDEEHLSEQQQQQQQQQCQQSESQMHSEIHLQSSSSQYSQNDFPCQPQNKQNINQIDSQSQNENYESGSFPNPLQNNSYSKHQNELNDEPQQSQNEPYNMQQFIQTSQRGMGNWGVNWEQLYRQQHTAKLGLQKQCVKYKQCIFQLQQQHKIMINKIKQKDRKILQIEQYNQYLRLTILTQRNAINAIIGIPTPEQLNQISWEDNHNIELNNSCFQSLNCQNSLLNYNIKLSNNYFQPSNCQNRHSNQLIQPSRHQINQSSNQLNQSNLQLKIEGCNQSSLFYANNKQKPSQPYSNKFKYNYF